MAMSMWEYDIAKKVNHNKRFAYQLRPGMVILRKNSTPLLVTDWAEDYANGDVIITVKTWDVFQRTFTRHGDSMRMNILAQFEIELSD